MSDSESRKDEAITSVVDDAAELGGKLIGMLSDSKVWENVPIAKWGVSAFRVMETVQSKILDKKIKAFVRGASALSRWEVENTISLLEHDRHYAETVGEHLIEHIDRLDGSRKALMSAAVFKALAGQKASKDEFYRLARAIESMHLLDLPALRNLSDEGPYLTGVMQPTRRDVGPGSRRNFIPRQESLQSLGASSLIFSHNGSPMGGNSPMWDLTDLGRKFLELRLDQIEYKDV